MTDNVLQNVSDDEILMFTSLLTQLEPVEFIAISKILGIQLVTESAEVRQFDEVFSEMLDKFITVNQNARKELTNAMRLTIEQTKREAKKNAPSTKHSKKKKHH